MHHVPMHHPSPTNEHTHSEMRNANDTSHNTRPLLDTVRVMMTVDVSVLMRAVGLALLARVGESASCVVALPGSRGLEVQGVCSDGVASFKGIPYAAAPIGTLRWVPPQDATVTGTIDATSFKPGCNVAEDCL